MTIRIAAIATGGSTVPSKVSIINRHSTHAGHGNKIYAKLKGFLKIIIF